MNDPTRQEYKSFAEARDWFNRHLFAGELDDCYITLQRRAQTRGYYSPERFEGRSEPALTDEIALNPGTFEGRTDREILSTLVHEMVHQWQHLFGNPGRGRYHNKEWGNKMEALGLMPSSTGQPGGKRTGQSVTHFIIEGGLFDVACRKLLDAGFHLEWQSRECNHQKKPVDPSKCKYTCPGCGLNAWAKGEVSLICGECGKTMPSGH
jgi:hypothetical protein